MPKALDKSEINKRLQELRNVKQLHTKARKMVVKLKTKLAAKDALLLAKDQRIAELEAALEDKELQRKTMASYLYKADKAKKTRAERQPGKQPGSDGFHRPTPKPEEVTERTTFKLVRCPMCNSQVGDVVDEAQKYQEDIDLRPRKIVKHYTITRHWCSKCETYVKSTNTPANELSRIGPHVMGYVLYARYRLRLPLLKIKESLTDLYGFNISEGEIQAQLSKAKELFKDRYEAICEDIRNASVVYADETGWRMDGHNWYLWVFVSPNGLRYTIENTRGGRVALASLGKKTDRVIISDGYAVYAKLPGDNQQCWVHLLRVAKPASRKLYEDLAVLYSQLLAELHKPIGDRSPPYFEDELRRIQATKYIESTALKVQKRIAKHQRLLLTCLDYLDVLPENNTAERAIRPQVVMRKITGGSRSPNGADIHAINTSVIATELQRSSTTNASFFELMLPLVTQDGE